MHYGDSSEVDAFVAKMEREKRKKGYADVGGLGGEAPVSQQENKPPEKKAAKKKAAKKAPAAKKKAAPKKKAATSKK
jgi:hypothetical protein